MPVERHVRVHVSATGRAGRGLRARGGGVRGARDPARDRSPGRRVDRRPCPGRAAPRGAAGAPPAGGVNVAFFGTSAFGADVLRALVERGRLTITAVVSQPDRESGRGRRLTAAAGGARRHASSAWTCSSRERASEQPPPARRGIVVAFGQIIREPLLSAYPLVNLHPSLLPRWRGAAPIERAIMAGDEQTAVAVIGLVAELDAGPVLAEQRVRDRHRTTTPATCARGRSAGRAADRAGAAGAGPAAAAVRRGGHLRPQDHRRRPRPRLVAAGGRAGPAGAGALAAHRRTLHADRWAARDLAWRARSAGGQRRSRNRDGAAGGGLRRGHARAARAAAGRQAADARRPICCAACRRLRRRPS